MAYGSNFVRWPTELVTSGVNRQAMIIEGYINKYDKWRVEVGINNTRKLIIMGPFNSPLVFVN